MSDLAIFKETPWKSVDPALLAEASNVPTMLAPEEQQFYTWITSEWMRGVGAVVDLGSFAGGSTARLAAGHQKAGHDGLIYAYDLFRADERVKKSTLYAQGVPEFVGDNILDLTIDLLTPWTDRISLHPGRIEEQIWEEGPIEILVMDASKTMQSMEDMTRIFFPSLIPGRSLVVQQDYLFWRLPWIPIQMELLSDYFTPVACVPDNTVAFLNTKQFDDEALERAMVSALTYAQRLHTLRVARRSLVEAGFDVIAPMAAQIRTLEKHPTAERARHFIKKY